MSPYLIFNVHSNWQASPTNTEPFSLCPIDERSLDLLKDLYSQLLPHFTANELNVGLDETFDLGKGR